jgi:signal transduction histidine kinase
MRGMTRWPIERLTIRAALVLGFSLTLGLWLFAGYQFTRRMSEVQQQAATINARYTRAQDKLSTVRAQVLIASVYLRDALLDPDPIATEGYRTRLAATYDSMESALREYEPVLDEPTERARIDRLHQEIADFRATTVDVLSADRRASAREARRILNTRVVPKRETVMRVSEDVQAMNRRAFIDQQAAVADIYEATQRSNWRQLGLALAGSLGIALLATLYSGRLENSLKREREKDLQNARDLQRLSARLVSAQEEERQSIARELHDEIGQVLTAVKVEIAVAQRAIGSGTPSARQLDDALAMTDMAIHTVRDLSHLLHPAVLDDLGLATALDSYTRNFAERYGIAVEFLHDQTTDRLVPEIEVAIYRIVQEALMNVVKHAHARSCRVYLQRLAHTILITVEDDGRGFDVAEFERASARRGLGLLGIRERAAHLNGTAIIESAAGSGTRVTVELPAWTRAAAIDSDPPATTEPTPSPIGLEVQHG